MTVPQAINDVPSPYTGMERQAVGGEWRQGGSGRWNVDSDPYSGDTIVEIKLATRQDVDAAYGAAKSAQRGWRNRSPDERAQAMYRAAAIIDERREEITSWLVPAAPPPTITILSGASTDLLPCDFGCSRFLRTKIRSF